VKINVKKYPQLRKKLFFRKITSLNIFFDEHYKIAGDYGEHCSPLQNKFYSLVIKILILEKSKIIEGNV